MMEIQPGGKLPDERPPVKKGKVSWKSILGTIVVLVIVWQLVHVFIQSQGKNAGKAPPAAKAPTSRPKPVPTVTLGGRRISAGGGPVIALNPGLVAPGGHVGVVGSGFARRSSVVVLLRSSRRGPGKVVAHGRTSVSGTVSSGFTMPSSMTGSRATVIVQQPGGTQASAALVTPGGMGQATIDGKAAGKPGATVTVSATGFGPGERVNVFWGRVSGTPAATLTADGSGNISHAGVKVGIAPVGPTTMVLVGVKTHTTATAPYLMLGLYPNTTSKPYAVQAGKSISFSGSGFAPNEPVLVYLNASSGQPALTANSDSGGTFSVSFVVPYGLRGSQTLTSVGEQSRSSVTSGFDVLPYHPSAQASTYGALPGTTLSFYASGYAANEVVLVYAGGPGSHGTLVTAFRVDGRGKASAAGRYVVPSGVGPGLTFSLVGQKSGGTAHAKVSVSPAPQSVTVPPQPPYVLPPSLGGKQPAAPKTPKNGTSPGHSPQKASSSP